MHNTTCARCGGKGHIEADCLVPKHKYARATAYEPVAEPDEPEPDQKRASRLSLVAALCDSSV